MSTQLWGMEKWTSLCFCPLYHTPCYGDCISSPFFQGDISTLEKWGHFNFGLTVRSLSKTRKSLFR